MGARETDGIFSTIHDKATHLEPVKDPGRYSKLEVRFSHHRTAKHGDPGNAIHFKLYKLDGSVSEAAYA